MRKTPQWHPLAGRTVASVMQTPPSTNRLLVASWVRAGWSLEQIESRLRATPALSEDQRAALWVYAWVQPRPGRRPPRALWPDRFY